MTSEKCKKIKINAHMLRRRDKRYLEKVSEGLITNHLFRRHGLDCFYHKKNFGLACKNETLLHLISIFLHLVRRKCVRETFRHIYELHLKERMMHIEILYALWKL